MVSYTISNIGRSFLTKQNRNRGLLKSRRLFRVGGKRVIPSVHPKTRVLGISETEILSHKEKLIAASQSGQIILQRVEDGIATILTAEDIMSVGCPKIEDIKYEEEKKEQPERDIPKEIAPIEVILGPEPIPERDVYGEAEEILTLSILKIVERVDEGLDSELRSACIEIEKAGKNRKRVLSLLN